jgi:hypothetical protein
MVVGYKLNIFRIISWLKRVSKNRPHSGQSGRQIDQIKLCFWSGLFGRGAAESYDNFFGVSGFSISMYFGRLRFPENPLP